MAYFVKQVRKEKGMTQEELCKAAGVSRQIVSDLESEKEVNTTVETLQKLASALGCTVADIFA